MDWKLQNPIAISDESNIKEAVSACRYLKDTMVLYFEGQITKEEVHQVLVDIQIIPVVHPLGTRTNIGPGD